MSTEVNGVSLAAGAERHRGLVSADPERILIYRLGSLGDTVVALPCFHLIQAAYPRSERVVITNHPVSREAPPLEAVLKDGGFIHRTIPYPIGLRNLKELRRLRSRLRAERAAVLVYLTPARGLLRAWRDIAFFRTCGFGTIVGAPGSPGLQKNTLGPDGQLERECERLARTLTGIGRLDLANRTVWDLRITAEEKASADSLLGVSAGSPFLAVSTGGKAVQKDWGHAAWETLIRSIAPSMKGWHLVFVGGKQDKDRAASLGRLWPGRAVDLCGEASPRVTGAVLARAGVFVGHDSGPLHLADAVGAPVVGLYGSFNRPRMWHPMAETTKVIHRMSGLHDITPEEVAESVLALTKARRDAGSEPNGKSAARESYSSGQGMSLNDPADNDPGDR